MNNIQTFSEIQSEPFLTMGIISWSVLCLMWCLMSVALVYCWRLIRKLKNLKGELDRQVLERSELLVFSAEREKKALENIALANQNKKQLLSRINHEIRTPMNGVIGMSALLTETSLNSEQKEYNETIRSCGESLLTVINDILHGDILAHSKIESGKIEIEQRDFNLRNGIEEVLDVFHTEVELLYRIAHNVPTQIIGDGDRLRQVLMNVVENAVKFTHSGEILVSVKLVDDRPKSRPDGNTLELCFEIKDTGVGIDENRLLVLSRDLTQSETANVANKYSGVGLFICQKLIKLLGGSLSIHSKLNEGTTVSFTIPVKPGASTHRGFADNDIDWTEGKRVLIIDDNLTNGSILQEELEQWKLITAVASSGKQAMAILSKEDAFDLILTDLIMPDMDGIELAKLIRQDHSKLPIILLSKESDERGKHHPELFNSIVHKPIRQHILNKHIVSKLRQHDPSTEEKNTGNKLSANFALQYPLRILIAEDNRVNQKLAMKILCKLGYDPDIAADGKEVLEVVNDSKYDLILMDIQMPEMDGLEATRMIRLCLNVQPVIIAMTANSMQGDREECMRAGMDDYISKPVHLEELVIILERWAQLVKEKR